MMRDTAMSTRMIRLFAFVSVIAAGLLLRRFGYDLGLSFFMVKYGGSVLWGAMVFFGIAFIVGSRKTLATAFMALTVAAAVELSRLYHTPELDAFRMTLAGKLLLGRVFSFWNILAYAIGIVLAAMLENCLSRLTAIKDERASHD